MEVEVEVNPKTDIDQEVNREGGGEGEVLLNNLLIEIRKDLMLLKSKKKLSESHRAMQN